jgi:hypothetical protein
MTLSRGETQDIASVLELFNAPLTRPAAAAPQAKRPRLAILIDFEIDAIQKRQPSDRTGPKQASFSMS